MIKKYLPLLYFAILTLLIMGPLLAPGYFFLLDYIPSNIHLDLVSRFQGGDILNNLPFVSLLFILNQFLTPDILEKVLFSSALFLSGYLAYLFLLKKLGEVPRVVAATFYMINPFTYERFMAGHLSVLLAYILLPVCFYYFIKVFEDKKNKDIILAALSWTLTIIFSLHFLFITGILFLAITITFIIKKVKTKKPSTNIKVFLKTIFFLLLFNSFWLIPLLFSPPNNVLANADLTHFQAFRTASDPKYGLILNILGMYGFWRERTMGDEIILTKNLLPFWPIFYAVFLLPIFLGIIKLIKEKKTNLLTACAITVMIAVFLMLGHIEGLIGKASQWIFLNIPGFKGLREIQKLISLLILIYTVLIAWGLYSLKNLKFKWLYWLVCSLILTNIFIYNYKIFWAGGGQIKNLPYPASYKTTQEILQKNNSGSKILLLPWQMYMKYLPGEGRTIADPIRYFYPSKTIATYSIGMEGVTLEKETWEEEKVKKLLRTTDSNLWQKVLGGMNIKYIFIHKTPMEKNHKFNDWFLEESNLFELVVEDDFAKMFISK